MAENKLCPFCNASERVLKQNELAQVVLSNPHKVPGHFLVMPMRHIEQPWQLTPEELQAVFDLIFFVEQRVVSKLGDGVDIRQNYRPFKAADELKVNHVLFHVLPRSDNDYLYQVSEQYEKDLFADLDELEAKEVAKLLED
ncbi:MAG TPA: HIT domain-containing protein [Candidatus Saccharimonadales bacterium]|nr:HIT domain-containing protein [Candidatus Saccharimonadales bacterium]